MPHNNLFLITPSSRIGLKNILIKPSGVEELVEYYKEKYSMANVEVVTKCRFQGGEVEEFLREEFCDIDEGEVKGYIFVNGKGLTSHSCPVMVTRKGDEVIVVDYNYLVENKESDFVLKKIVNYSNLQKDTISCRLFSLYSIKNCLLNPEFMEKVMNPEVKFLELPKKTIGQGKDNYEGLSREKQDVYVHEVKGEKYNLKSWYKSWKFAEILEPGIIDKEFPEGSLERVFMDKIDVLRREFKEKKSPDNSLKVKNAFSLDVVESCAYKLQ